MTLALQATQKIPARRFVMYLPDNNRYGERIQNIEHWVREACLRLARLNGGATRSALAQAEWSNKRTTALFA